MTETILVNFHCHSIFSDGEQTPEALAGQLSSAGVRYAALTDHDSIEGLPRFHNALRKRGIGFISGVEVTTQLDGREVHLLGYGFDTEHAELAATLISLRQVRGLEVHSIAESLRKVGNSQVNGTDSDLTASAAPNGQLEIGEAIALIHRAGGCAFLAHPLLYAANLEQLSALVEILKSKGLDGIEAIYEPYSEAEQKSLCDLAEAHGLLVCAGTDIHGRNSPGGRSYAIKMPRQEWRKFRRAVFSGSHFSPENADIQKNASSTKDSHRNPPVKAHHFRRRSYVLRIFLPTFFAIALFLGAIWGIILPSFEQTLLDRKREMIQELTNSAWSILASYQRDEQNGLLTREQAQAQAISRLEALRYGSDSKDYFWIQDLQPKMIMHPYRTDLNGQDVAEIKDPRGVAIFVQFADLVRREGEGFIDYIWQWKDDPERLEPKESYIKGFEPWGWVIGTGLYTDDVNDEIGRIEQSIINYSLVISGIVVILLLFVLQQSLRIERERQEVVDSLHESTDRYHTLVEATTEGTLLVLDNRCRYANPTFLNMLGYTARQMEFLELEDILPHDPCNQLVWQRFEPGDSNDKLAVGEPLEGCLARSDGSLVECILTLNPMAYAGQQGFILLAKDIGKQPAAIATEGIANAFHAAPVGIFRARAARRAVFLEINTAGLLLLPPPVNTDNTQQALADLFSDPNEYNQVYQTILADGEINNYILHFENSDATSRFISLSAKLIKDEQDHPSLITGILEDVTADRKEKTNREALIEKLQTSLLFLHEPLEKLGRDVVVCKMDTTIQRLSRIMTTRKVTAALVASETSEIIGIITDHDLRERVLAENIDLNVPIHTIMSAPLTRISENSLIYEALMRMEEKGVRHLAVEDQDGQIVSVIDNKSLIQFQRYGPIVLLREISRCKTPDEVAESCQRTTPLVKALMDSSTRPRHVTYMLSSICDAATEKLIQLAIDKLGPPPAPFAFIAMGSQGRQEQTLLTDQDNGIIFSDVPGLDFDQTRNYFLKLGSLVCDGLNNAGYPFCRGNVMASNPKWCRSLPGWLSGFDESIRTSEPQEIIDLSIFFDLRTVYGDTDLTHELRHYINKSLLNEPALFHHFAQNALMFKPPFRLLGNIYLGTGATEHSGEINLKDAMMPMVSFARLYSLRHQVNQTHTLERIEALAERNIILTASRDEIITAYDFLMQLRLENQLAAIQTGRPLNNIILPGKLGYIQQELLKQAFAQIAAVQKKINYDFLGGG